MFCPCLISATDQTTYDFDHTRLNSTIFSPLLLISPEPSSAAKLDKASRG